MRTDVTSMEPEKIQRNIKLRAASRLDVKLLHDLLHEPGSEWLDYESAQEMFEYYSRDAELARIYIITADGSAAGMLTVNSEDRELHNVIDVDHILVREPMRGNGIGRAALTELVKLLELSPDVRLRTQIKPGNTRSVNCFTSVGFKKRFEKVNGLRQMYYIYPAAP